MTTLRVTAGQLVFYGVSGRGFTLKTSNLIATLDLADTGSFPIPGGPYPAGSLIDASGNLAGEQTLRNGPAYFGGTSYPRLWYEGSLSITARLVPAPGNSSAPVAVRTRFTLRGTLRAFQSSNISGGGGPAVFDVALVAKGRSTVVLGASYDVGGGALARDALAWFHDFGR